MNPTKELPYNDFDNLKSTHAHEEKLRDESMAIIKGRGDLRKRLVVIEKALALIFAYTHDYQATSEDELTLQYLGIRLFNAGASAIKLGLSGYYQPAFALARDIMEVGFLIDYFSSAPGEIGKWKASSEAEHRKKYSPVQIRIALDERDGNKNKKREKAYAALSEYASHATFKGFRLTARSGLGELGPFVEEVNLKAWLEEMVLRLGPSAVVFAHRFPGGPPNFARFREAVAQELVAAVKGKSA